MSIWQRLLAAIGRVLSAFFNIRIKLKYVLVLVILLVAGCIGVTYNRMINAVGGKADYDEAMRYIEIKDLVDEYFIAPLMWRRIHFLSFCSRSTVSGLPSA